MLAGGSTGDSTSLPFGLAFADMNIPFIPPLEPMRVTGEDLSSLHENQQPGFEAYSGAVIGANDGTFQAQSDNIQDSFGPSLNFDSNEYLYGGFPASQYLGHGNVDLGEPSRARTSARARVSIKSIKMVSPKALDERSIEHRRETQLKLEIIVSAEPLGIDPPVYCIRVPRTKSVKKSGSRGGRTVLDLNLEVLGATTGKRLMSTCRACSTRESDPPASVSMVDFVAKEDLINLKNGKASVAFRFLCLPVHHGTMDEEYELRAKIMKCDQVLELHTFPNRLRVVSHRRRIAPPAILPQGIENSTVTEFPFNPADIQDISNPRTDSSGSSGASVRETRRSVRVQSESSLAQNPTVDVSASIPSPAAHGVSEPAGHQGHLQTSAAPVNNYVSEEGLELSHVFPRRGPVSGGEEIALIVSNLPSTIKLYARFGCNITLTAHLRPGVLSCLLPPAAGPGLVRVTLSQAPSADAEQYGTSLASFEYEADSTKAVSIIMKVLGSKEILESMPLIQRLLQSDAGSPALEVEPGPSGSNMPLRSSLPESAFLGILSALKHRPDFPRLLATVNEQGQTLLHLAVHLRYRKLVQKLIHWGIDPNVRDVNGSTALHAGYLCGDRFVVGFLEAEGATPFVLDELGRPPAQLAASISSDNGTTTMKDEEIVPVAEGCIDQSKEQSDRAIAAGTQETAFGLAAEKVRPSETLSAVGSGDTTQSPQSIDKHLIHVNPGHVVPLHNRHRTQDLISLSLYLDKIILQPVLDRGYTFKLFIENEELELRAHKNQTWTPAQRLVVYPTSEMRAEIHRISDAFFWERHRLAIEEIDPQALFDGHWNSSMHEFTVPKDIVVGNHHWLLELQFSATTTKLSPITTWGAIQQALQNGWDPMEEIARDLSPFFEHLGGRNFRCIAPVWDGKTAKVCGWEGTKKDRTISHICGHLNYNPFRCNGQCNRVGCTQRFAEKRNLDQHIKPDSVHCPKCDKKIEHKRNLKKHMDNCDGITNFLTSPQPPMAPRTPPTPSTIPDSFRQFPTPCFRSPMGTPAPLVPVAPTLLEPFQTPWCHSACVTPGGRDQQAQLQRQ